MGSSREAHVKSLIRRRYAHLAVSATAASDGRSRALAAGYRPSSLDRVPQALVRIWSGCGALAEHLDLDGVGTVVDVGCGGGLDACLLANRDPPPRHIVAVDLTPEMLTVFGEHLPGAPRCRVSRVGSDAEHLPLTDACCDLVVANAAFNLALDMASAIAESARILRPGGDLRLANWFARVSCPPNCSPIPWATPPRSVASRGRNNCSLQSLRPAWWMCASKGIARFRRWRPSPFGRKNLSEDERSAVFDSDLDVFRPPGGVDNSVRSGKAS